ncbi:hypothetical protein [Streptomyces sp. BP-8]|uniref:FUSC family protein n=1 Tax=Streptomyces sirii TaxID=3127701 RepID=A0ABZ2QKH0_9ACTN
MTTFDRLQAQLGRIPPKRRLWAAGIAGITYFLSGMAIKIAMPLLWKSSIIIGSLLSLAAFVILGTGVSAYLEPNTKNRLATLRKVTFTVSYLMLAALAGWILTVDRTAGVMLLTLVAMANYFFTGDGRYTDPIRLTQLRTRITQRVAFRIIAIVAGTMALNLVLPMVRSESSQQNANFSFTMGTYLAAGAACLKVHSRARKICTQINSQARTLILALDNLTSATTAEVNSRKDTARHEWQKLDQLLENRIETGLPLHGTVVLPISNRQRLHGMVNMAIVDTPQGQQFVAQARAELQLLAQACASRIDTTL